eukprot:PhM_4_TR18478/c0_g1_i1/m.32386
MIPLQKSPATTIPPNHRHRSWHDVTDCFALTVSWLDADSVFTCCFVSRRWYTLLTTHSCAWTSLGTILHSPQSYIDPQKKASLPSIARYLNRLVVANINTESKTRLFTTRRDLTSSLIARPIAATTTDHPSQWVDATLDWNPLAFWSSTGHSNPQDHEALVYQLCGGLALVSDVVIRFYREFRQTGHPLYTTEKLRVHIGVGAVADEDMSRETTSVVEVDKGIHWYHVTDWMDCPHIAEDQTFALPKLFAAQFVKIEMKGMRSRQIDHDSLFYACVDRVQVRGVECPELPAQLREAFLLSSQKPPLEFARYDAFGVVRGQDHRYHELCQRFIDAVSGASGAMPNEYALREIVSALIPELQLFESLYAGNYQIL